MGVVCNWEIVHSTKTFFGLKLDVNCQIYMQPTQFFFYSIKTEALFLFAFNWILTSTLKLEEIQATYNQVKKSEAEKLRVNFAIAKTVFLIQHFCVSYWHLQEAWERREMEKKFLETSP